MRYALTNQRLRMEVDTHGAELKSVKTLTGDREYMWQADPDFWGRTSPVLFPFVGGLKNKEYLWQGRSYPMGQHGFARDMEFILLKRSEDSLLFQLASDAHTLEKYPFPFVLEIGYRLEDNAVTVSWKVKNTGDSTMHFSIGAHPAFNCPICGEENKTGYQLVFPGKESLEYYGNANPDGLAEEEDRHVLSLEKERAVIREDFFDRCTYFFDEKQTGSCGIADPEGRVYVMLQFDTPLFAVWSPEKKQAPFLCIEPWYGRCDAADFTGTLEERKYSNTLESGEVFEGSYVIRYFEFP